MRRRFLCMESLVVAAGLLTGGGECGTPLAVPPEEVEAAHPDGPGATGQEPTDGVSSGGSGGDGAQDAGRAGLRLDALPGSAGARYDIYDSTGSRILLPGNAPGAPVALDPGEYVLKQSGNDAFVFAAGVVVGPESVTAVPLGALQVETVPGSAFGWFDLYDAASGVWLSGANEPGGPVAAPAGVYRLTQYFNASFTFADAVTVQAGQTAVMQLGAIVLETVPGSVGGSFDVFAAGGVELLSEGHDPNLPLTAPPGAYVLKQYFNESLVFAGQVVVRAGAATRVAMGAIRYNGPQAYDLYRGAGRVAQSCLPGEIQTAPPGTYALFEFFTDRTLASGVVVTAGQITEVQ